MHDIVVVSDLHLGRGKNFDTGRYFRLEAFFYDADFDSFCRWLCEEAASRKRGLKLVLNGDTFDLLRIEPEPQGPGAKARDRRYGPILDPAGASDVIEDILAGHPIFVTGVARVLAAGHRVVFTPGNHDQEVQWAPVQAVIRQHLLARVDELLGNGAGARVDGQLLFEPWFHHEPGRIWIEHGCQYDPENSFQYFLRGGLVGDPECVKQCERDLPMGTFFQRYLYNDFGNITFIVPNSRSNLRYFRWLAINKPRLLARIAFNQVPFFLQVLRRIAKSSQSHERLARAHEASLDRLAQTTDAGEALYQIEGLKTVRGSAAVVTRGVILQVIKIAAFAMVITFLGAGLWFTGFAAINKVEGGVGFKAVLFLALNFLFLLITGVGIAYVLLRPPGGPSDKPPRRAAKRIADLLDVPIVTFGHTHDEVVWRFRRQDGEAGWYFNTGTWIAVFTHDELLPRERVQYTFLRVRDHTAELLHWSPGRHEAVPVIILEDDERPTALAKPPPDVHA